MNKGVIINMIKMGEIKVQVDMTYGFQIVYGNKIIMDNDGNPAQFKSENNYAPTPKKYVYINEGIELPLNWKKVRTEQGKRNEDEM